MPHTARSSLSDQIDPARLEDLLGRFADLTAAPGGVTRLAYTELERDAHAVFRQWMEGLGLDVRTDAAGNTLAELPATETTGEAGLPAIGTGSHLDSVPAGGRYDGIVGVVAAMEVARVASGLARRRRPWRFVAFAAEEGARFGQACNGSRAVAGLSTADDLHKLTDADGVSMAEAMTSVGLSPSDVATAAWDPAGWHAFVELHVEQGTVLEEHGADIGIVDAISGSSRLRVTVLGLASHTGGTPMHARRDALVTASRCVLEGDRIARDPRHRGTRVTVGRLRVRPGSITTIPGEVEFTVDIRDVDGDRQRRTAEALAAAYQRIGAEAGTGVDVEGIGDVSPVTLPEWIPAYTTAAAADLGLAYRVLPSGASHDSQQVNEVTPTGMIFVPSRDGRSHVPDEFTTADQVAAGTRVLAESLLRLDRAV